MGAYINPVDMSKEEWLRKNATDVHFVPPLTFDSVPDHFHVCLVNNGPFTAAGIAWNERELQAFNDPSDGRAKSWFTVPKDKLLDINVSDLSRYL